MATDTKPAPPAAESQLDTVARLGAQRRKFKDVARRLQEERDELKKQLETQAKELEALKASGASDKIAELEGKLREVAHRAKFTELAKAAGVKEKAIDHLWEKSGYKPEGDAPDDAKITAAIEAKRAELDYAFESGAPKITEQAATLNEIIPGPGRGQGGTRSADGGQFAVTQEQLRNPLWMMQNRHRIAAAAKDAMNLPTSQVSTKLAIL